MTDYPYSEGDTTVLGPEIFASADGDVISWQGENYVKQSGGLRDLIHVALKNPVAVRRAANMLSMCMLSEGDGDAPTEAENRENWETGTAVAVVKSLAGIDVEDVREGPPTAVLILTDNDDGTINVHLEFDPPYDNQNEDANSLAYGVAGSFVGWFSDKMEKA